MSFIGVLTTAKNENKLKHLLKESSSNNHIFYLHKDNVSNVRNITFETILIGKPIEISKEKVRSLVQKANYLILNSDRKENVEILKELNLNLITYGLNSKCTITTSSIGEEQMMICLQRGIEIPSGKMIEPQEFLLKIENEEDSYTMMEFATLSLLYPDLKNK
ncbi:MAG: hypothetical protein IJ777_02470 [Clostridia bacterium]|nr:hypothetical protein [Clostridia bacterium]